MSYIPHFCDRNDCIHNNDSGVCHFFVGDMYFLECILNGTMYEKENNDKP